ncbi:MAG: hypothetical protein J0M35_09080 [Candidatus Obscuribacter phosphatis]|uniref:Uncharacterized protein n=1 Tax=Candidatus Obscuribacter phosphatis TaxID=1906157 RepID=A0A8J7TM00_9BACT|nr:hypothetical protein [Candidatus Obscuribacter phosphatis]
MKAKALFITCLMTVDAFFIGFAYSFNTHPVLIEDPSLPAKQVSKSSNRSASSSGTTESGSAKSAGPNKSKLEKADLAKSKLVKKDGGKAPAGAAVQEGKGLSQPASLSQKAKAKAEKGNSGKVEKKDKAGKKNLEKGKSPEKTGMLPESQTIGESSGLRKLPLGSFLSA